MSFATIYGNCAAMGFSPQQARQMSIWQYVAAVEGFAAAHDPDADKRLSETDADALFAWVTEG